MAMPLRARSTVESLVMSLPSNMIEPELTGRWPTMARNRLVLPTPLRPSTQVTLPDLGLERNAAQRLRRAVVEIDVADVEHYLFPWRMIFSEIQCTLFWIMR